MNPTPHEISQAEREILRQTGLTVRYRPGAATRWLVQVGSGSTTTLFNPATRQQAARFDDILSDVVMNSRSSGRPSPGGGRRSSMFGFSAHRASINVLGMGSLAVGGPIGMAAGAIGGAAGLVTGAVGMVTGLIRTVVGIISAGIGLVFHVIRTVVTAGVALVGTALGSLTAITLKAAGAITEMGKSITALRGATGMSAGQAGGLINRFSAFGLHPDTTVGMFENSNPISNAIRARLMGASSFDAPGAIPAMAARFQSMSRTPFGNRIARSFLGDMDTPEMRAVLMRPVGMLRDQERFQNRVQGAIGVNPAMIARVGQGWDSVTNKLQILTNTVLIRLGSDVLPYVTAKLEQFTNWIAGNLPSIGKWITSAVDFFIKGAETVFNFFSRNGPAIAAAAQAAFGWIVHDLPPLLMRGGAIVLRVFATAIEGGLRAVDMIEAGWNHVHDVVLVVFDRIMAHPLMRLVVGAAGVANGIRTGTTGALERAGVPHAGAEAIGLLAPIAAWQLGRGALGGIGRLLAGGGAAAGGAGGGWLAGMARAGGRLIGRVALSDPVLVPAVGIGVGALGYEGLRRTGILGRNAAPVGEAFANSWGRIRDFFTRNPGHYDRMVNEQWARERAQQARTIAGDRLLATPIRDTMRAMANAPQGQWRQWAARNIPGMGAALDGAPGFINGIRGRADSYDSASTNWEATLKHAFDPAKARLDMNDQLLKQIAENTGATAKNTGKTADSMMDFAAAVVGRAVSYMVQDEAMNVLRT